ncbi:ABC-three component system protein [Vibrio vulnificus]|uniref:ABC-three component system protein n=1 Tax=Vibrio vulnificus TaxID=672 RepID=UPI001F5E0B16|nr:ABC-three component system protein [Vibrio vulnificus]
MYAIARSVKGSSKLQTTPVQNQIYTMSPDDWEHFIEEWMTYKSKEYFDFERLGGAGDQGRDVVGYVDNPVGSDCYTWDNFQCKHYGAPLSPSQIWVEIGKICYFSFNRDYPFPRKYYFIAPRGVGTKLSNLLKKPNELKSGLYENWDMYCKNGITDKKSIVLDGKLKTYIDELDFSVFDKIATIKIIIEHSKTQFHVTRFGTQLPKRPDTPKISSVVGEHELIYVKKLLQAYDSHCSEKIVSVSNLDNHPKYKNHLKRSREDFLNAETLRNFSRDTLPKGEFERIQSQILSGVIDIVEDDHENGFDKVKEAVREAKRLQLPTSPLSSCLTINDRGGVCHQLANNNEISWCEDEC